MTDTEPQASSTSSRAPVAGKTTVLYIAGSGRSGSTLLERMLGTQPGFVNIGELVDLSRRVLTRDELCGCGETFSQCSFWLGVGEKAFGGWTPQLAERLVTLQHRVARQRHLAQLMVPAARREAYSDELFEYGKIYSDVFAAIAAQGGARVVVDASKGASLALALTSAEGLDVRLLHLVRDARGVAFSWAKSDVSRPHGGDADSVMGSFSPRLTAARWAMLQTQIAVVRRRAAAYTLVRYEDLVATPAPVIARAMAELGIGGGTDALSAIRGQVVDLPPSHGLSGNPSRFRLGPQTLRADEQWRREMSAKDRRLTTAIALAPLAQYGYLRRTTPKASA